MSIPQIKIFSFYNCLGAGGQYIFLPYFPIPLGLGRGPVHGGVVQGSVQEVHSITRCYFGGSTEVPVSADYRGNRPSSPAIFRNTSGLWAIRGYTRAYFRQQSDIPAAERPWWTY